jgi:hypothetical protein
VSGRAICGLWLIVYPIGRQKFSLGDVRIDRFHCFLGKRPVYCLKPIDTDANTIDASVKASIVDPPRLAVVARDFVGFYSRLASYKGWRFMCGRAVGLTAHVVGIKYHAAITQATSSLSLTSLPRLLLSPFKGPVAPFVT